MTIGNRTFHGWRPSPPDQRDLMYSPSMQALLSLPASVDLSHAKSPILNQSNLGSCGPFTAVSDLLLEQIQGSIDPVKLPSPLFTYYYTRLIMGTVSYDSGVDNRSLLKSLNKYGWCDESTWPYVIDKFTVQPSPVAISQANARLITEYRAVPQDLQTMKACLAGGDAIIFGFTCYSSLNSSTVDASGDIPMPAASESVIGGHDVLIVGYDDAKQKFKLKNSWGTSWGKSGYGTIPYSYASNPQLASDFWTVTNSGLKPVAPPSPPTPPTPSSLTVVTAIRYEPDPKTLPVNGTGNIVGTYRVTERK